ncbi:hypothetical protein E5Q_04008 [Mixia osmundae IAM 14324]|uniref:Uncharacterized protein n=1 Tax=Mixia osmundae (strain CBS 9802 / IAM 14324 / JCM 22182 / KY 12970) TaxID=764103 RepID=G7E3C0_MIXOS|nr:hypothetical protein E5Q_04008 [Mixia osmundae IAM 14324]
MRCVVCVDACLFVFASESQGSTAAKRMFDDFVSQDYLSDCIWKSSFA